MRRNLLIRILQALVIVAVASSFAHADNFMYFKKKAAGGGATECPGDLICQNFEGTGYDNVGGLGGVWTAVAGAGGVSDPDDTTASVLRGSQQFKLFAGDAEQSSNVRVLITDVTELYGHFRWKAPDVTPSSSHNMLNLQTSAGVTRPYILWLTTGKYRCYNGTAYGTSTSTLSDNTAYHIWFYYKGETSEGANNGIMRTWISTTATKPGVADCETTVGTDVDAIGRLLFITQYQETVYVDQAILSTTEIGNVAE